MRVHSHRSPSVRACTLVVLFFVLSFNAYACLMPVNIAPTHSDGKPLFDSR